MGKWHDRRVRVPDVISCVVAICCLICGASCSTRERLPGYVYYRLNATPTTLDPAHIVDVSGGTIAAKIFNGLVKIGDRLSVEPDIADHWTVARRASLCVCPEEKGRVLQRAIRRRCGFQVLF